MVYSQACHDFRIKQEILRGLVKHKVVFYFCIFSKCSLIFFALDFRSQYQPIGADIIPAIKAKVTACSKLFFIIKPNDMAGICTRIIGRIKRHSNQLLISGLMKKKRGQPLTSIETAFSTKE